MTTSLLLYLIITRCIFQQPSLLYLRHVADERLASRLDDLVEDDPVGLAILWK